MSKDKNKSFIEGLRDGDEKIIYNIYQDFFPKIKHFIVKNEGSHQESEEVFQMALFQLISRLRVSEIEITSSFEGYFFTVCKNLWRRELNFKKRWVRNENLITLTSEEDNVTEAIIYQERWDLFENNIAKLSDNCRKLLRDHFDKVSYSEIVKKFNYANENVAFQRMFKCKKKLTDLIKKDKNYLKLKGK